MSDDGVKARVVVRITSTHTVATTSYDVRSDRGHVALALSLLYGQNEAARRMGISPQTVKNHLSALYGRLGVGTAAQAAFRLGWLVVPDEVLAAAEREP